MTGADQLAQARDDLALLVSRTASLEASLHEQEAQLSDARRVASAGGPLADVVLSQTRRDAAHGILQQHRQDVEQARVRVDDAEQVAQRERLLSDSRQAFELMQRTAQALDGEAKRAELLISQALDNLRQLTQQHEQARRTIRAALPAQQRADWLAQVDPTLTEGELFPWRGSGLHRDRFPLLDRLGVNQ